jgi:hypothetical protein
MTQTDYQQERDGVELDRALYERLNKVEASMGAAASVEEIEEAQARELADILREHGIEGVDGNAILKAGGTAITLLDLIKKLKEELEEDRGGTSVGCVVPAPGDRGIAVLDENGEQVYATDVDDAFEKRFEDGDRKTVEEELLGSVLSGITDSDNWMEPVTEEEKEAEQSFAGYIQETFGLNDQEAKLEMDLFRFERAYRREHEDIDADALDNSLREYIGRQLAAAEEYTHTTTTYSFEGGVDAIFESYRSHTVQWQDAKIKINSDEKDISTEDVARIKENVAALVAEVDPDGQKLADQVREAGVRIGSEAAVTLPAAEQQQGRRVGG